MKIRTRWIAWLIASAAWILVMLLGGREFVAAELGHRYQYIYSERPDAPQWELGLSPSFYEIFQSPAKMKLPASFTWLGYMGVDDWNLFRDRPQLQAFEFPDGDILYLDPALTEVDKSYVKDQFAAQSEARRAIWLARMLPWIATALLPPALVFLLFPLAALFRWFRQAPTTAAPPNS